MEAGKVKGAPDPEPLERPRRRKATEATSATESEKPAVLSTEEGVSREIAPMTVASNATDGKRPESRGTISTQSNRELFDKVAETAQPPRRPRAMTEFRTAPRPNKAD